MENPVRMYHPDLPRTHDEPVEVEYRAYSAAWRSRGWLMVEDDETLRGYPVGSDWQPSETDEEE